VAFTCVGGESKAGVLFCGGIFKKGVRFSAGLCAVRKLQTGVGRKLKLSIFKKWISAEGERERKEFTKGGSYYARRIFGEDCRTVSR